MPQRKVALVTGEHYHVISRSSLKRPIFTGNDAVIAESCLKFYTRTESYPKFSYYLHTKDRPQLDYSARLVTIEAYCIMPTHFHLLLKQEVDSGIKTYLQRSLVSYSHYYNKKHREIGPLFSGRFKAVHIETEEQFMYVSRYIHLNPSSAGIVEDPQDYPYSSLNEYRKDIANLPIDPSYVLDCFSSKESYLQFVLSRKDYQRKLQYLKSQLLDYDDPGSSLDDTEPGSKIL